MPQIWCMVWFKILLAKQLLISKMSVSFLPKSELTPPTNLEVNRRAFTVRLRVPADSTEKPLMYLNGNEVNSIFLPLMP